MKARDLANWLMERPDDRVVVTWEGTLTLPSLYRGAEGVSIIDADDDFYRPGMEGKLTLPQTEHL